MYEIKTKIKATYNKNAKMHFDVSVRDKAVFKGYKIIDTSFSEIVDCRIYWPNTVCFCALRVNAPLGLNNGYGQEHPHGTGKAGGYGYCKESAAVADSIQNAGFTLSKNISGVGTDAVKEALTALANIVNKKKKYVIEFYG